MNKSKKIILPYIILVIASMFISLAGYNNMNNGCCVTQLSPNSLRQMMGYVIKTSKDSLIVIDGGTALDAENLKQHINENGGKVDAWFLTHAHDDHAGAFTEIARSGDIRIKKVYAAFNDKSWYRQYEPQRAEFSEFLIDTVNSENLTVPRLNEKITIDGISVEILGVNNPEITENAGNEQSMVIRFDTGRTSLLILGDAGEESSKKLLENQRDKLDCDVVQMAHHGQQGATYGLYAKVSPKICLWPTPDWLWNNDSGGGEDSGPWKTKETRAWMESLGVVENYVAKDGDISINID